MKFNHFAHCSHRFMDGNMRIVATKRNLSKQNAISCLIKPTNLSVTLQTPTALEI